MKQTDDRMILHIGVTGHRMLPAAHLSSIEKQLNLVLDIGAREDNGYHQMRMVMQSVSLADIITVDFELDAPLKVTSTIEIEGENIVSKAVKAYGEAAGLNIGGHIHIEKHIPMTGGMGGGSADCAAVLTALDATFGKVGKDALDKITLSLGADVPFAMVGGTAYATGVGEKLTPLPHMPHCFILLVSGGVKDSTGAMFGRFDNAERQFHPEIDVVKEGLNKGDLNKIAAYLGNSFAPLWQSDRVVDICTEFATCGALGCSLSGAGPTLFAIFDDEYDCEKCANIIRKRFGWAEICNPTEKSIEIIE